MQVTEAFAVALHPLHQQISPTLMHVSCTLDHYHSEEMNVSISNVTLHYSNTSTSRTYTFNPRLEKCKQCTKQQHSGLP